MSLSDLLKSYSSLPAAESGQKRSRTAEVEDGVDSTRKRGLEEDISPETIRPTGDLATIGRKHGTDKVTHHGYYRFYPRFIEQYRSFSDEYGMLEIGVENCFSLQTWKDYFPNMFIYGMDINFSQEEPRARVYKVDQSKPDQLHNFIDLDLKHKLCFIIDDGSHIPEHQLLTFDIMFPILLPGGTYIIEDIETSYWSRGGLYGYSTRYGYKHPRSCIEVFKSILDDINREFLNTDARSELDRTVNRWVSAECRQMISTITFAQNCIIITKKTPEESKHFADRRYRFQNHL